MVTVIEEDDFIEIQTQIPTGLRVFFAALALFPLLAPYELLLRPDWDGYFTIFFLFSAVISAGAVSISAALVWAATAGYNTRIRFDRAGGAVTYATGATVVRWRSAVYPLAAFVAFDIEAREWNGSEPTYTLVAVMAGGQRLNCAQAHSRVPVEALAARVYTFLR